MSKDSDYTRWPPAPDEGFPKEMAPPADLEDRVVGTLLQRGLLRPGQRRDGRPLGWQMVRASFAAAACLALVAMGFFAGRLTGTGIDEPLSPLTGAENDLYALMLYETDGYDRPTAIEARARYGEYSRWVAEASRRGQFVTGEDLEVERGWLVTPSGDGASIQNATSVAAAPLSGIFFIRAHDPDQALELAQVLPHIKYGGSVLVQKTIPTDTPPE